MTKPLSDLRVVLIVACAAVMSACAPQLELVLVKAKDLNGKPAYLRFEVVDLTGAAEPKLTGPYSTDAMPNEEFAEIVPDTEFLVDVIGCKTAEQKECEDEADFLARGCTPALVLKRGEARTQQVDLHSPPEGNPACNELRAGAGGPAPDAGPTGGE